MKVAGPFLRGGPHGECIVTFASGKQRRAKYHFGKRRRWLANISTTWGLGSPRSD